MNLGYLMLLQACLQALLFISCSRFVHAFSTRNPTVAQTAFRRHFCHGASVTDDGDDGSCESRLAHLPDREEALALQQQAEQLRNEARSIKLALEAEKEAKIQKQIEKIDTWLDSLLVNVTVDENTQMLNTVEQVTLLLQQGRFSQEQVNKMFDRICETGPPQSRSRCSPIMELLVDAAGKLDCVERADNPNKRWNGRVERHLRKRLFAMDFGMDLENKEPE